MKVSVFALSCAALVASVIADAHVAKLKGLIEAKAAFGSTLNLEGSTESVSFCKEDSSCTCVAGTRCNNLDRNNCNRAIGCGDKDQCGCDKKKKDGGCDACIHSHAPHNHLNRYCDDWYNPSGADGILANLTAWVARQRQCMGSDTSASACSIPKAEAQAHIWSCGCGCTDARYQSELGISRTITMEQNNGRSLNNNHVYMVQFSSKSCDGWKQTAGLCGQNNPGNFNSNCKCSVVVANAKVRHPNGSDQCMGKCNEDNACPTASGKGACMRHDLCSELHNAAGFSWHDKCGDEAEQALNAKTNIGATDW